MLFFIFNDLFDEGPIINLSHFIIGPAAIFLRLFTFETRFSAQRVQTAQMG